MRKLIFLALSLSGIVVDAQVGRVGINTDSPKATLHVVGKQPAAQAEGIVFPHASQAEINTWQGMGNLEIGTTVYNTDQRCLETWNGIKWYNHCGGRSVIPPGPPTPPTTPGPILPAPAPPATLPSFPAGLELGDSGYYIASIYDDNYLPYTQNVGPAQFGVSNPDGHDATNPSPSYPSENVVIDVQGRLDHTGIEVGIPIKSATGTSVTIPAFSVYSKVAAGLTQNNIETEIELHIPAQTFGFGGGYGERRYVKAILRAKDPNKPLLVKKLDMNIGNGADYRGVPLAEFKYFSDDSRTNIKTFYFNAVTGIPDLNFNNSQDALSGMYSGQFMHRFIYVPAYGLDGKVWLSNNLGAAYANLDDYLNFNPGKQAESDEDHKAYGSLFQWGRIPAPDNRGLLGHELVNWISKSAGQPKIPSLNWFSGLGHRMGYHVEYCPVGFKTPSTDDWKAYANALVNDTSGSTVAGGSEFYTDLALRLTRPGVRHSEVGSSFNNIRGEGRYSTTTNAISNLQIRAFLFTNGTFHTDMLSFRSAGLSVRCIKQ